MSEVNGMTAAQRRGTMKTVAAVLAFMGCIIGVFFHGLNKPRVLSGEELKNNGAFIFEKPRSFKPFSLLDYNNETFSEKALANKWSLVFFGFTYCPDVCPTTMALLKRFYDGQREGDYGEDLQIILVSVDPARDTPEKLKPYVQYFDADFMGVTGEFLDIHRFATQLNIPFRKETGAKENYSVDHSGNIAIINPQGHYVGFFRAPHDLAKLNLTYQSIRLSAP